MTFADAAPLVIRLLLVLLVMAMVGVEDVGELARLVFGVDHFDHGFLEFCAGELALQLLNLLAGFVVEWVEQFLFQASLPLTSLAVG